MENMELFVLELSVRFNYIIVEINATLRFFTLLLKTLLIALFVALYPYPCTENVRY